MSAALRPPWGDKESLPAGASVPAGDRKYLWGAIEIDQLEALLENHADLLDQSIAGPDYLAWAAAQPTAADTSASAWIRSLFPPVPADPASMTFV